MVTLTQNDKKITKGKQLEKLSYSTAKLENLGILSIEAIGKQNIKRSKGESMTNTYTPELTQQQILNSIYYWTSQGTWAPGIAFPAGPNLPNDSSVHDRDFFFRTTNSHLYQYQGGDYPYGSWVDLQEAANAILSCGTTLPGSGNERDLFNKYDDGTIYQWITVGGNGAWRNIGTNKRGLPLGADSINFTDNNKTWRSANLGLLLVSDDGYSPILATDQSFLVKKDLATGGFISTQQGEIWIGHGRNTEDDIPKIVMMHAEDGYDTLYLRKLDPGPPPSFEDRAHLDLGDLTVHGTSLFDSNATFSIDVTVAGTAYCQNDYYLGTDTHLHRISDGVAQLLNSQGQLGVLDLSFLFCDHFKAASGGAMYFMDTPSRFFNSSYDYEVMIGEDASQDQCLVIGYKRSADRAYMQLYGVAPLDCMQFLGVNEAGSHGAVAIYNFYYNSQTYYDAIDDLQLIKNYTSKTITDGETEKTVIDPDSLPFLRAEGANQPFWDLSKSLGFIYGVGKKLVIENEALKAAIHDLQTRLATIENAMAG